MIASPAYERDALPSNAGRTGYLVFYCRHALGGPGRRRSIAAFALRDTGSSFRCGEAVVASTGRSKHRWRRPSCVPRARGGLGQAEGSYARRARTRGGLVLTAPIARAPTSGSVDETRLG